MVSQRARAAFERAQEWEERRNAPKATSAYQEAVAIEPDWPEPHRRLGALLIELGRYDEATAAFRRLKPLVPPGDGEIDDLLRAVERIERGELNPAAFRYYAQARDLPDEQLDEKLRLCQEALKLNPSFAAPYAILGRVLLAQGYLNQARAVLERGLACDPSPFVQAQLLFNLGTILLVGGQRDAALPLFAQVVALNANPTITRFATKQLEAAQAGRI